MKIKEMMNIDDLKAKKFEKYKDLLLEWNNKINLTAITEENEIILKHFIDSCTILKYIENNQKIIDIGTGAGFPGIPLKIMNESLDITLVDSLNKRINFLNELIKEIELNNIRAIHARAEDIGKDKNYREKYDVATSRAVANLSTLLEYLMPLVKVNGICICMKGPNIENELNEAKKAIEEFSGKLEEVYNFKLPNSDIERNIIIVRKIDKIKLKYPRKAGIPAKEPIK